MSTASPRDIIAECVGKIKEWPGRQLSYKDADAILTALTTAGYRVVREGELDAATVERCAQTATSFTTKRQTIIAIEEHVNHLFGGDATIDEFVPVICDKLAAALRDLAEAKP